jgi:hypothetical protein
MTGCGGKWRNVLGYKGFVGFYLVRGATNGLVNDVAKTSHGLGIASHGLGINYQRKIFGKIIFDGFRKTSVLWDIKCFLIKIS